MENKLSLINFRSLYSHFDSPISPVDCGKMCSPKNGSGKPFCCDNCQALPVAYKPEWAYLKSSTDLWHLWQGDECESEPCDPHELEEQTPEYLLLLVCKGPAFCEREFRSLSCRQFPFFPYITANSHFIGFTYDWEFKSKCWVIQHLEQVTDTYRKEFTQAFDEIFSCWPEDFDSYVELSEETREHYSSIHRRVPILHRNGSNYLLSPKSERQYKLF
ncbi:MAG: hypothetical protein NTZ74_15060 [Chloroflexi bacterium]|nr:hypothetical protein [Chloroflexota bacterium]